MLSQETMASLGDVPNLARYTGRIVEEIDDKTFQPQAFHRFSLCLGCPVVICLGHLDGGFGG